MFKFDKVILIRENLIFYKWLEKWYILNIWVVVYFNEVFLFEMIIFMKLEYYKWVV